MVHSQHSEIKTPKKLVKLLEYSSSPAATLVKSYLRDTNDYDLINSTLGGSDISSDTEKSEQNNGNTLLKPNPMETNEDSLSSLQKRKPRFDVSSATELLREKYPFRVENFADTDDDEIEEPPLAYDELLKGLHMYVDVREKEDNRSAGIKTILRRMGATVHEKLDKEVTHVIFREGLLRTYKKAKSLNCHILSILWVDAIRKTGRRIAEEYYPALNLEVYESPLASKKIRRYKCMTPDLDSVKENHKPGRRLQDVKARKLITDSNGSSQENTHTPDVQRQQKRRRTMCTTKTKMDEKIADELNESSDPDFLVVKRRKTENWNSSNVPFNFKESNKSSAILDNKPFTKRFSDELKNRNIVINKTLSPSVPFDLIEGSQEPHSFLIHKSKVIRHLSTDSDTILSTSSLNSEQMNCHTSKKSKLDDNHEESIELSNRNKNDDDNVDSPDLKKVLEALENDKNGSLRKRLLQGLGLKIDENNKQQPKTTTDSSPEMESEEEKENLFITKRKQRYKKSPQVSNNKKEITTQETPTNHISENQTTETLLLENKQNLLKGRKQVTVKEPVEKNKTKLEVKNSGAISKIQKTRSSIRRQTITPTVNIQKREENIEEEKNIENEIKISKRRINRRSLLSTEIPLKTVQLNKCTTDHITNNQKIVQKTPSTTNKHPVQGIEENTKEQGTDTPLQEPLVNKSVNSTVKSQNIQKNINFSKQPIIEEKKMAVTERRITRRSLFLTNTPSNSVHINGNTDETNKKDENSTLNDTTKTVKKTKLFNLKQSEEVGSDVSLPEMSEPIICPYSQPANNMKTPKRRIINLEASRSVDNSRRSSSWFKKDYEIKSVTKIDVPKSKSQKTPSIVCTRLHRDQIDIFEQIVQKLGKFEIENHVSERTTHLVAGGPLRTLNMLRAIIRGCWIVKYEWILESLDAGQWLNEENYELIEFSPAVQKCRIERQTFGEPYTMKLFNDCGNIYIANNTSPKPHELEYLIKLAGGRITTSQRSAKIIVGQCFRNCDTICVNEKWILESISQKRLKSFKKYLILDDSN